MKKFIGSGLALIICIGMLAGCGLSLDAKSSTIYVKKNGMVISADVAAFDKEYYDQAEFKDYIQNSISEYDADHNKAVKLLKLTVEDGTANVQMSYQSYQDYTDFNGIELYSGTVASAKEAGYSMDIPLIEAAQADGTNTESILPEESVLMEGSVSGTEAVLDTETEVQDSETETQDSDSSEAAEAEGTEEVTIEGSLEPSTEQPVEEAAQPQNLVDASLIDDAYKIVILRNEVNVKVDGTILFVTNNPQVIVDADNSTVEIGGTKSAAEADLTYIIYK